MTRGARALPGRRRTPASGQPDDTAWQTWWMLARGLWLPDRESARRRMAITPQAPLGRLGASAPGGADGFDAQREAFARRVALPLLLDLGGPATRGADLRGSALLALARISTAPEALERVLAAAEDERAPDLVRESAALALGLFRRTRADLRLPVCELERLREAALALLDDLRASDQARAFAGYALALLGDQPFPGEGAGDGRDWTLALWSRLARPESSSDVHVALLTALGHQPVASLPESVRDGLRAFVVGRPVLGRRWDERERSHALTALARLAPCAAVSDLARVLGRRREAEELVRAAALAVGAHAAAYDDEQRAALWPLLERAVDAARDPWTRGLLRLAQGGLIHADREAGSGALAQSGAPRVLLAAAGNAPASERGYALIALALAARPAPAGSETPAFGLRARDLLLEGLARTSEDDGLRAAHAVALGLLGAEGAVPLLVEVVGDRDVGPQTRGHGAVALAQLEARGPEALRAAVLALNERAHEDLRAQAALALSWMRTREALALLLRQAADPEASEHLLAQVAVALGRLGDAGAVATLRELAQDARHAETGRALAVVALGLVLDPEPRPSLLRLSAHANYPARSASLHELLSIL